MTFQNAVAQSLSKSAPAVVLRLDRNAPEAINQVLSVRITRMPDGAGHGVRMMLRRGIASSPLNPVALRLYGASYGLAKRDPRSRRFFALAERTSRRDVGTQMYFIVESATKGDAPRTVERIDRALRVSRRSRNQLFPLLGRVLQLPDGAETLGRLLRRDTPWFSDFLSFAVDTEVDPAAIARLVMTTGGFPDGKQRPAVEQTLFRTLEGRREYTALVGIAPFMATVPRGLTAAIDITEVSLRPDWQPLSWQISSSAGMVVNPIAAENGKDLILQATMSGGVSAEAARKLLLLKPGTYRLTASQNLGVGVSDAGVVEAHWQFDCVSDRSPSAPSAVRSSAATRIWSGTPAAKSFAVDIEVPVGCRAQVLSLRVRAPSDAASVSATVGPLSLKRIG